MSFPKYLVAILLAAPIFPGETPVENGGFVVHEWGTFTSVAGEGGSAINWQPLSCKDDLPGFVNDLGFRGFKFEWSTTVRMETPVLYFYAAKELEARVKVTFPQGLITESFPAGDYAVHQKDDDGAVQRLPSNLNGIDTSLRSLSGSIEWSHLKVQPDTSPVFPTDGRTTRYYAARETDSAPLSAGVDREKFLFYRGIGRFPVPLTAEVRADGSVAVTNRSGETVPMALLFESSGGKIGYRIGGVVDQNVELAAPQTNGSMADLRGQLESALIARGLFPKEAHAMVETWKDSWFEEGARLIYIVPGGALDKNLPLQVDPAPAAVTRVFVGRIELITPEVKRVIEEAVVNNDWHTMDQYSRFLRPMLERIYPGQRAKVGGIMQFVREAQRSAGAGYCR